MYGTGVTKFDSTDVNYVYSTGYVCGCIAQEFDFVNGHTVLQIQPCCLKALRLKYRLQVILDHAINISLRQPSLTGSMCI